MTIFDLMNLIDRMRDTAIVVTDADLDAPGPTIRYVNDAFVAMSGLARELAIGRSPRLLQGRDTDRRHTHALGASLREGRACRDVLLNYRADGSPYLCAVEIHPVHDGEGRITSFAAFEMEVERRRGRPSAEPFGRWRRVVSTALFASEVVPGLHFGRAGHAPGSGFARGSGFGSAPARTSAVPVRH
ncbi:PAS domain-containing protein [Salinarimonas ramus]|uniref:PAS domain-containing protein n=1 Tax=Salinarimonas ramus TaxID=690164 RepID=A0A917Q830_9HYPH|nr:PAS domain-containing protein [Salinarimonas ramus]GGK34859.1 hypothetical protein GCM10011322_22040 [Salinarimonas ramus]